MKKEEEEHISQRFTLLVTQDRAGVRFCVKNSTTRKDKSFKCEKKKKKLSSHCAPISKEALIMCNAATHVQDYICGDIIASR